MMDCYFFETSLSFGLIRFQRSIQGPSQTSTTEIFFKKYLAVQTVNHFQKMLHHRNLNVSLIRLSESKLKCWSAKFEEGKIVTVFTLYTMVPSWYIAKGILNFKKYHKNLGFCDR